MALVEAEEGEAVIPSVESVWCEDCGEVRPVTYDRMPADERNDHDATDILCDHYHIIATLHHPKGKGA